MSLLFLLLLSPEVAPDPGWLMEVAPVEAPAEPEIAPQINIKTKGKPAFIEAPTPQPTSQPAPQPTPQADPPRVDLICDGPARMGVPLTCTVEVTHPKAVSVTMAAPDGAKVLDSARPAQDDGFGQLKTSRRFSLQPKTPKPLYVEGVSVAWQHLNGAEGVVEVPTQKIPVKSSLGGAKEPKFRTFAAPNDGFLERHGPLPYRRLHWPSLIASIVLVGLIFGGLLGWVIKRYYDAHRRAPAPYVDPRPAHVIALEALVALAAEDLPGQGEVKAFYTRLSEIIRDYLERRFKFSALEMTSDEIRGEIEGLSLAIEARVGIEDFLAETDLVKFADFSPSSSAIDTVMRLARGLVMSTKEEIAEPEPEPDAKPEGVSLEKGTEAQAEGISLEKKGSDA